MDIKDEGDLGAMDGSLVYYFRRLYVQIPLERLGQISWLVHWYGIEGMLYRDLSVLSW